MCTADTTTVNAKCVFTAGGTKGTANAKTLYLNVSVWANDVTATAWSTTDNDFYINFYGSAWASGSDYYPGNTA